MTIPGSRKVNKKGRTTGALRNNRHTKAIGQFVMHGLAMIDSPAWQVLSLSARRVLDRIEIEHMRHGGAQNGRLPVTYDDFVHYGIHRHAIAPAIRQCEALGFLEVAQRGHAGNAEYRSPNHFRLTYLNFMGGRGPPTNEWSRIETIEAATDRRTLIRRPKKQNPSDGKRHASVSETATETAAAPVSETITTAIVRKPSLLSISPVGSADRKVEERKLPWTTPTLTEIPVSEYLAPTFPGDQLDPEYLGILDAEKIGRKISY
jgi:hypothetical protein